MIKNKLKGLIILTLPILLVSLLLLNLTNSIQSAEVSFTFNATGDLGAGSDSSQTLANMASESGVFSFLVGDLSYSEISPESEWCNYVKGFFPVDYPFELLVGNHEDEDGPDGHIDNFAACLPDKMNSVGEYAKQYYFDYPSINPMLRVVALSPDITIAGENYDYSIGSARYQWVENVIDDARNSGIQWIVVGTHKVCLSMGTKSCEIGSDLVNLLVSKKVDLVVQGHEHNYQRTKQLALNENCNNILANSYNPNCVVNDGSTGLFEKNGTIFLIVGTGGKSTYPLNLSDPEAGYFSHWNLQTEGVNGHASFNVSLNQLDVNFIPSIGSFTDSFTIASNGYTPTPVPTPVPTRELTFPIIEDSTIKISSPDLNYGLDSFLEVDLDTEKNFLLKFDVSGLEGETIVGSKINLYNLDSASDGGQFYSTSNNWQQSTVTWNNAPLLGGYLASLGNVSPNIWYQVGVNNVLQNGMYSYRVTSSSANGADYASSEDINFAPYLTVSVEDRSTPSSTPTPSPTPTPIPSPTPTPTPTPTPPPAVTTLTYLPTDDALIRDDMPNNNFGNNSTLEVDNRPVKGSLLKFNVDGIGTRSVLSAKLRIFNTDSSNIGGDIRRIGNNNWSESTVTWNNAPVPTTIILSSLGSVSLGNWYEFDLTSFVSSDDIYSFYVSSSANNGADYYSSEGIYSPELILEIE